MIEHQSKDPIQKPIASPNILQISAFVYGAFALIGLCVMYFWHQNLGSMLSIPTKSDQILRFLALGGLATGVLLVLSQLFEDWFSSFRNLKIVMISYLGNTSTLTAVYLALVSSVGEELFFRGAIQPVAGIGLTSVLFGLMHIGPKGEVSSWSVWAASAGVLLGVMTDRSGSLWPAIVTHFCVNCYSIINIQRSYRMSIENNTSKSE
jgi:membrane protease YdiL (CAAX protease family)